MIPWEGFVQILEGVKFQIHVTLFEVFARTLLPAEGQSLELHKRQGCRPSCSPTNLHTVNIFSSASISLERHRNSSRKHRVINPLPSHSISDATHPVLIDVLSPVRLCSAADCPPPSHLFSSLQSCWLTRSYDE